MTGTAMCREGSSTESNKRLRKRFRDRFQVLTEKGLCCRKEKKKEFMSVNYKIFEGRILCGWSGRKEKKTFFFKVAKKRKSAAVFYINVRDKILD